MTWKNKDNKRNCKICDKEIKVKQEFYNRPSIKAGPGSGGKQQIFSEEGVLFNLDKNRVWFCNKCWEKIIEYVMDRQTKR